MREGYGEPLRGWLRRLGRQGLVRGEYTPGHKNAMGSEHALPSRYGCVVKPQANATATLFTEASDAGNRNLLGHVHHHPSAEALVEPRLAYGAETTRRVWPHKEETSLFVYGVCG